MPSCPCHRKQQINSQTSELEALEARIREMEQRLKSQPPNIGRPGGSPRAQRPPVVNAFADPDAPPPLPEKDSQRAAGNHQQEGHYGQQSHKYGGRRHGTARESQQAVPGALPPTPVGSEGECDPITNPRATPRPPTQARLGGSAAGASIISSSSSITRVKGASSGDDSGSVHSMSESLSFADYVVVSRLDGDGEKDV